MASHTTDPNAHPQGPLVQVGGRQLESKPLFTAEQIQQRVAQLAAEIESCYPPEVELTVLICLDGAFVFGADLVRQINRTTRIETIKLKSYEGTRSSGTVSVAMPVPDRLKNRHVLIVEDIVDSGKTLLALIEDVTKQHPASIKTVVLLDKPSAHQIEIQPDLIGFSIGPRFVIGYGLDVDGRYRNLPFIAEVFE